MKKEYKIFIKKNKSKTYIFPIVKEQVNFLFKERIINTYCSFSKDDLIFCVLYNWSSDVNYLEFEDDLMSHHLFEGHKDYGKKVLYKFRLPQAIKDTRDKFYKGDLKNIIDIHKDVIIKDLKERKVSNLIKISQILDKNSNVPFKKPLEEDEIFLNNLKEFSLSPKEYVYEGH